MGSTLRPLFVSLLALGVLLVFVGQVIVIVLATNGKSGGDGLYRTNSQQRDQIRAKRNADRLGTGNEVTEPGERSPSAEPGTGKDTERPPTLAENQIEVVYVSGVETTKTIPKSSKAFDLRVSGSKNSVVLEPGTHLRELTIAGTSNRIAFGKDTLVSRIQVAGFDNHISVPSGIQFDWMDSGVRNKVERKVSVELQPATNSPSTGSETQ